ncbi:glycerol-3-phosphate responsive antiterminator [Clostridium intestinale]|uniref:Glycerol-3-phosphate responsive antiterminator n=1 Tax=Clostridium intestinale TaxID=36845 RepID=A0A7D6ZRM1_9CLOT|nr:glycerol-3-phosphate responsive antiterminator [Clostridium intestinale]QLY80803.1 glycerol-3-phosphate responsive antiterminator [Clostridium intestinale]
MNNLGEILIENPVVAAIRNEEDLDKVIESDVKIVFVLFGSIVNIAQICRQLKDHRKIVFVHIDLVEGLKGDSKGIEYVKKIAEPYGIISTKPTNIKYAKNLGLNTIQRIFIIDSLSLETGIKNIKTVQPDAVEVMPGVASKIIKSMEKKVHLPIIAGGLIQTKKDIIESIGAGAVAVSTTKRVLWELNE